MKPEDTTPEDRDAVAGPLQCTVGRPAPERVSAGDTVECDVREPRQETVRLTLLTPEATAFANELLARPGSGWRRASGCSECAWGKVAGCWRCGSR